MTTKQRKTNLSKSKYLAGLQCLKRLYLQCYHPELAGEIDEQQQALFDQGTQVGLFAQRLFPSGVLLSEDYRHHREAVSRTRQLIDDKSIPALFEAAFTFEDIYIRVDILERLPRNRWRMIEVKSSTGVKDYHLPDVAIQKYVLEQCGLTLSHACLMHLNRDYVYDGKHYQYDNLFTIEDVMEEIEAIEHSLPEHLAQQWETLKGAHPPEIEPGLQCSDPFTCDFYPVCNAPFPEDWTGYLPRMGRKVEQLNEMGITSIHDIPDDFPLSASQRRARDCFTRNTPYYDENLTGELNTLKYPLYFMDFETLFPALPRYKGMRPYDHIPFQWSVHVQETPGSEPEHYEFLHHDTTDPREPFIASLLSILEKYGTAPILVYSSFESTRLSELSRWLPKYAKRIEKVTERLWDLLPVIRNNVYHSRFMGSFSIKYVLPSLIPDMSYDNMEVADGTAAGLAYERMTGEGLEFSEREKVRQSLLDYCRQDSLAMVRLLHHLSSRRGDVVD
jgi:predicted RecB family nuclease